MEIIFVNKEIFKLMRTSYIKWKTNNRNSKIGKDLENA